MKDKVLFVAILGLAITGVSLAIADPFDLPIVFAQVSEEKTVLEEAKDYKTYQFVNGTFQFVSHYDYLEIENGSFLPYRISQDNQVLQVETSNGKAVFDKNTGGVTFFTNSTEVIQSDSYVVRGAEIDTDDWFVLEVNQSPVTVFVSEQNEEDITVTVRRQNFEGTFDINYKYSGFFKVTAKFTNEDYPNHKFAFTETLNLVDPIISLNNQEIDIRNYVGQTFPREVLIENIDLILQVQDIFYYSGLGFDNLWSVGIFDNNRIALDYANVEQTKTNVGQTVELDPTFGYQSQQYMSQSYYQGNQNNAGCVPTSGWTYIDTSATFMGFDIYRVGVGHCSLAMGSINVSGIPDSATVTSGNFKVNHVYCNGGTGAYVVTVGANAEAYTSASSHSSTVYGSNTMIVTGTGQVACSGSGSNTYSLSASGISDMQGSLSGNNFSFGSKGPSSSYITRPSGISQLSRWTPEVEVTYTLPQPDPPTGLTLTQVASNNVDLSWSAPTGGATTPTGYKIERSLDNTNWTTITSDTGSTNTTYTDTTGLSANTLYYYRVFTYDGSQYSATSTDNSFTSWDYPDQVTGLTATDGEPISLSWSAPASDDTITGYKVYRDTVFLKTVVGTSTTDSPPTLGQSYSYTVSAVSGVGEGSQSTSASAIYGTPPDPPTSVQTSITDPNANPLDIFIQYSSPTNVGSGTLTGFEIYRDASLITTVGLVSSYTDTVPSSGTYTYLVRAVSTHGTSTDSNTSNITTPTIPNAPASVTTSIPNINTAPSTVVITWTSPSSNGGSALTGYNIYRDSSLITNVGGGVLTFTDTDIKTVNTQYTYEITAVNNVGESSSTTSNITTPNTPLAPTLSILNGTTQLTWTTPSSDGTITGYNIYRDSSLIKTTGLVLTYTDMSVLNWSNSYDYEVSAVSTIGEGDLSNTVNPIFDTNVDDATAFGTTGTSIIIDWTAPTYFQGNITNYSVYYSTPYSSNPTTLIGTTANTYLNLYNQLQYDANYAFMVLVNSPLGNTSVGNVVNATTTENLSIVTYDPTTGANWFDIDAVNQEDLSTTKYTRVDNGDTVLLEIEYPTNYEDMTCDVNFKFGQQTLQYVEGEDMTSTALDAEHQAVVMQFNNQGNEVITVECADQIVPNSGSSYTVTTTFGNFPLLTQIADFRTGQYGTNGMFGALDLITLFVVIISMVGFNRINPIAGVIIGISSITGLAYFGVINLPPAIVGIFALLAFLAWGVTRK